MQNKGGLYSEILREDNFNFNIVSEVKLVVLKLNSKKKKKKLPRMILLLPYRVFQ